MFSTEFMECVSNFAFVICAFALWNVQYSAVSKTLSKLNCLWLIPQKHTQSGTVVCPPNNPPITVNVLLASSAPHSFPSAMTRVILPTITFQELSHATEGVRGSPYHR